MSSSSEIQLWKCYIKYLCVVLHKMHFQSFCNESSKVIIILFVLWWQNDAGNTCPLCLWEGKVGLSSPRNSSIYQRHPSHFWKQEQFWSMIQLYSLLWRAPRAFVTDISKVKHVLDHTLKPQNIVSSAISAAGTEEVRHFSWTRSAAWGIGNIHTILQSFKYLFQLGWW